MPSEDKWKANMEKVAFMKKVSRPHSELGLHGREDD